MPLLANLVRTIRGAFAGRGRPPRRCNPVWESLDDRAMPAVTTFPYLLPGQSSSIAAGPDHALWFTVTGGAGVDRLDPATGAVVEHPVYSKTPVSIVAASDGRLYFAEYGDYSRGPGSLVIGRIDPATGARTDLIPPRAFTRNVGVVSAAAGADGDVYFSSYHQILRLSPATGAMRLFNLPILVDVSGMAGGSAGVLTFTYTEVGTGRSAIGRLDTLKGKFSRYYATSHNHHLGAITQGPGGRFYFEVTGDRKAQVGVFDPATHAFRFAAVGATPGTAYPGYGDIVAAPDGDIVFSDGPAGYIARWDPSTGAIARIPTPGAVQQPDGLAYGPDGALYFTDDRAFATAIGRYTPD